jgi:hypothetical protein
MTLQDDPDQETTRRQWPFALVLVFGAVLGLVLTQMRDGWPENVAWLAVSVCAGGLVSLFRNRVR